MEWKKFIRSDPKFKLQTFDFIPISIAGYSDIVGALIEHKAEVNAKDSLGRTPFHYASQNGMCVCFLFMKQ